MPSGGGGISFIPSGSATVAAFTSGTVDGVVIGGSDAVDINKIVAVSGAATAGAGTSGSPWTGWDTAITWTAFTQYDFATGYYAFSTCPSWLKSGIKLIASAGVYLVHTGSGNAFVMDAGSTVGGTWIQNVELRNLNVLGNYAAGTGSITSTGTAVVGTSTLFLTECAVGDTISFGSGMSCKTRFVTVITDNTHLTTDAALTATGASYRVGKTTNGFYLRGLRNSTIDNCTAHDIGTQAVYTEACVTNELRNFRCTYHEPTQSVGYNVRPKYGIVFAGRGADYSTCWTVTNPVIEGCGSSGVGIWLKTDSYGCTVIGGTSEGHIDTAVGMQVSGNYNNIIGIDIEANASASDLLVDGAFNQIRNVYSQNLVTITGSANILEGGHNQNLTVSGGDRNFIKKPEIGGTLTDTGTNTTYEQRTSSDYRVKNGVRIPIQAVGSISGGLLATNAFLGDIFAVGVSGSFTLSNPTNATNGQRVEWKFSTSGVDYTITYGNKFLSRLGWLPKNIPANGSDWTLVAEYNSTADKWEICEIGQRTAFCNLVADTASNIVEFDLPETPGCAGGVVQYSIDITDGADALAETGTVTFSGVNVTAGGGTADQVQIAATNVLTSKSAAGVSTTTVFAVSISSAKAVVTAKTTPAGFGTLTRLRIFYSVNNLTLNQARLI